MPANKNALIRYKTIDNCLRNKYRRWTIDNLVDACCDALYDMEGISKGVSLRTVPMSENDYEIMKEAVEMLKQLEDFDHFSEMADMYEQHGQFDEDKL